MENKFLFESIVRFVQKLDLTVPVCVVGNEEFTTYVDDNISAYIRLIKSKDIVLAGYIVVVPFTDSSNADYLVNLAKGVCSGITVVRPEWDSYTCEFKLVKASSLVSQPRLDKDGQGDTPRSSGRLTRAQLHNDKVSLVMSLFGGGR